MEWGPDFCLVCDKQTTGGAYCSQACRLTDETSGLLPQSSTRSTSSHSPSSSTSSTNGLHLPPALNFSALRRPSYDATPSYQSRPSPTTTASRAGARPQLSPSSSRSSLSSISSASTAATTKSYGLTESAMHQLQDYVSAFDQTRDMKRRITVQ